MELGGLESFTIVPDWKGNRDKKPKERLSLKARFLRGIDQMGTMEIEDLTTWRDETYADLMKKDPELERKIKRITDINLLIMLKLVIENTYDYHNFVFFEEEEKDARKIWMNLRMPSGEDQSENLLAKVFRMVQDSTSVSEEEMGNYASLCDGSVIPQSENVPDAKTEESPENASTQQDQNGSSKSAPTSTTEPAQPQPSPV